MIADKTTPAEIVPADEPLAETVDPSTDDDLFGLPDDHGIDAAVRSEREFLTSLIWSPDTAAAVHAIVGDHAHRDRTAGHPADRIPLAHPLFIHPAHSKVFALVIELVDEGAPVSPAILQTRVAESDRRALQQLLLEIAAPTGFGPLPGGRDVPHLARGIIDGWYRRGYSALLSTMSHAGTAADTDDLAGRWAALTDHQQAAERRRLAVTDALAAL